MHWVDVLVHVSDYLTDALFLTTIDAEEWADTLPIVEIAGYSLLAPVAVLALKGLVQRCRGSKEEAHLTWASILGLQTIYFKWGKEEDLTPEEDEKVEKIKHKSNLIYLMFEDSIQFPLQIVLTTLAGSNLGFFQLFSPLVTFYSLLFSRIDGFEKLKGGWRRGA